MKLTSHAVMVSVSRQWHRSEICNEGHSCWGYDCLMGPTASLTSRDSVGLERLVRDPGAGGAEREIAEGDYRWMKNESWKWRMITLSLLALPSSNLLVLCHVIKLLKGQFFHTLHHTNPSNGHFSQSLALYLFFFYTQTYIQIDR